MRREWLRVARHGKRRGISIGTAVMLLVTVTVLVGTLVVLTRLNGDEGVAIDTDKVLEALNLSSMELSFSEIPLRSATAAPTEEPQQAANLPEPTIVPTAAPTPTATPYQGGTLSFTIAGSVCLETGVRQSGYYSDSKKYDFDEVLDLIASEMTGDVCMVTLENLIYEGGKVSDLVAPEATLQMLKSNGINVVSLGFAKALDKGVDPLLETVNNAKNRGLRVIGAYAEEAESAAASQMMEVNGVKVALLHYTDNLSSAARKKISSQPWMMPAAENAAADIARVREQGAQVVVVSLHWGKSGSSSVTNAQKTLAQKIADAGADIIVGAGSRMIQPAVWLERAGGGQTLCCYSLGSLLSDSRTDAGVAGMLLQLTLQVNASGSVSFTRTEYTPTYIWRYKQDGSYHYRVVPSDQRAPEGMDSAQTGSKERACTNAKKYLGENCPLTVRVR